MHPSVSYNVAKARTADLRREAERDALAKTGCDSMPRHTRHAGPRLPAARRRVFTFLRARIT